MTRRRHTWADELGEEKKNLVLDTLLSKIGSASRKFHEGRFTFTTIGATLGGLDTLLSGELDWKGLAWLLGGGLAFDALKAGVYYVRNQGQIKKIRNEKTTIGRVMGSDYLEALITNIREYGCARGECVAIEEQVSNTEGTNLHREGYTISLMFTFADGTQVPAFFKYNYRQGNDEHPENNGRITRFLSDRGHSFVPKVLSPDIDVLMQEQLFTLDRERGTASPIEGTTNRGLVYEWVNGANLEWLLYTEKNVVVKGSFRQNTLSVNDIPVDALFENMWEVYEDDLRGFFLPAKTRTFHNSLVAKIQQASPEFASIVDKVHKETITDDALLLKARIIHGDLHQGNIMVNTGEVMTHGMFGTQFTAAGIKVFDWDNAEIGIPYQDFFHFAVISDFERSDAFPEARAKFLKKQKKVLPGVTEAQTRLIEFETYVSLLMRYHAAVAEKTLKPEFEQNILTSCRYLLEKSRAAVDAFAATTGNDGIRTAYDQFVRENLSEVEATPFDQSASVGYAHTVNHKERRIKNGDSLADVVRKNQQVHQRRIERRVKQTNLYGNMLWFAAALNTAVYAYIMGATYVGMQAGKVSQEHFSEAAVDGGKGLLAIYGLALLGNNIDRIVRCGKRMYHWFAGQRKS